jgi:topoisomerase-4 subunit A
MIYTDGTSGRSFAKRFNVTGITRDKEYDVTQGNAKTRVVYISANPNSESEIITIQLHPAARAHIKSFDFDFSTIAVKGRSSMGNTITKYPVKKISHKEKGISTLGGRKIYLDGTVGRLNIDERGKYLGEFDTGDLILVIYKDGNYSLTGFELSNRFEMRDVILIEKYDADKIISGVYYDGEQKQYFAKRFYIEATVPDKRYLFISETAGSKLNYASTAENPQIEIIVAKGKKNEDAKETIDISQFIDIKGWKSQGKKLSPFQVKEIKGLNDEVVASEGVETNIEIPKAKNDKISKDVSSNNAGVEKTNKDKSELKADEQSPKKRSTDNNSEKENKSVKVGSKIEWDVSSGKKKVKESKQTKLF